MAGREEAVKNLLWRAPPGEFQDVLGSIKTVVQDDSLVESAGKEAFVHNSELYFSETPVDGSNKPALVTPFNRVEGEDEYYDPRSGMKFRFDHVQKAAADFEEFGNSGKDDQKRLAIEKAVDNYVTEYYTGGNATVVQVDENTYVICVKGQRFNSQNFWNGAWANTYRIDLTKKEIQGELRIVVHYFEDGNVQLHASKDVSGSVTATDADGIANDAVNMLKKEETAYQNALSETYSDLSQGTFKSLRRQLPVTRELIDWGKISSYRVGKDLPGGGS
eukprot:Clim_evm25s238 gene=Clim_evmTU25s238